MENSEFQRILALGLGRAVLHLHNHVGNLYSDLILDACLHNLAYDPQVEGSRGEYMIQVMRASGETTFFANAVLESLPNTEHGWDAPHRFELARLLAQSGSSDARKAMYSAFATGEFSDSDVAKEFIVLDGIQGLLFVVRRIGAQLVRDSERWEDDYLLDEARRLCGREAVDSALQDAAMTDVDVRGYLDGVHQNSVLRAAIHRPDPSDLTYSQVRSLIEAGRADGVLAKWGQTASDSDLRSAASDMIQEHDPQKLKSYLGLFRKRRFPLEFSALLRLAELQDGPVPRHALSALANLQDESIRSLAFRLVETSSSMRAYSIDLLINNFREGDDRIVELWCNSETDPATINAFDRSLRSFFHAHPDLNTEARLLRSLYEREPCAHCRRYVVERLKQMNALTEDIRRECEYDSYADTRLLVTAGSTT